MSRYRTKKWSFHYLDAMDSDAQAIGAVKHYKNRKRKINRL